MLATLRNFFVAPIFPDDPEKTRIAQILNSLIMSIFGILGVAILALPLFEKIAPNAFLFAVCLFGMLLVWLLMRRGRIKLARVLFVTILWGLVTGFLLFAGGLSSPAVILYLSSAIVAGILISRRWAVVVAITTSLSGFAILMLEINNLLPARIFSVPSRVGWVNLSVMLLFGTIAINMTLNNLKDALAQANRRLEERRRAEEELRQRAQEITIIHALGHRVNAELSLDQVIDAAIQEIYAAVEADLVLLFLREEHRLYLKGSFAKDQQYAHKHTPIHTVGQCLCGLAVENKQRLISLDIHNDPRCIWKECKEAGLRSFVALPLRSGEQIAGVLGIASAEVRDFEQQATFLETLASEISIGLRNALLYEQAQQEIAERIQAENEIQRQMRRLAALRAVDTAISSSFDLGVTLDVLLKQVVTQLGVDAAAVLLFSSPNQDLKYIAQRGFHHAADLKVTPVRLGESYAGRAVIQRKTVSVPDLRRGPQVFASLSLDDEKFVSYFGVPLLAKGQVKGVLEVFQRAPLSPDSGWLRFLEALAGQAAIAIDNTELFDGLERSNLDLTLAYNTTLEGWAKALEMRDVETKGHSQRVTNLTMNIARRFGIPDQALSHVYRGALLHDIGKMGIPDDILLKPGSLNDDEWQIMRQHPAYAKEMLSSISYLRPALEIPYCHHEKWDGSGYPRGLVGEQIPLSARIFTVVDVWDALCSTRPYRSAWPEEEALDYILERQGVEFDPRVVDMFMRIVAYQN